MISDGQRLGNRARGMEHRERVGEPLRAVVVEVRQRAFREPLAATFVAGHGTARVIRESRLGHPTRPIRAG